MGRPKTGALSEFDESIRFYIKQLRHRHPGWGAKTILSELKNSAGFLQQQLPSQSAIARYLSEQKLTKSYQTHHPLPLPACLKAKRCNSLWQIDGQGNTLVTGVGYIGMLNIKDVVSKLYVCCFPVLMQHRQSSPNTLDYQTAMRLGFMHHGRPRRLQSDHASVFYDNNSKSPFPTLFCLWLIALDIQPCFSRVHRPTDQGIVERAHQTMHNQIIEGRTDYRNWNHLFDWCEQRRDALNKQIPSASCGHQAPLVKYPQAAHSGRFFHPTKEAELIDLRKVFKFLAKGKWYRKVASSKTIKLGGQVYYVPNTVKGEQLIITFCKKSKNLLFQNDKELIVAQKPLKGISIDKLMGDIGSLAFNPNIQLELPLNWNALKVATTL